ncbi:amidohydrolase [Williamsia sp. 1138]|uniref:amidohydrolase family protein n=1 Tax=Williamsia sp. 1138 TaxID=1903117 RepID=UPI000A0FE956|nr:amidohydrolase family protein [Williamsia sp. 1138]OZG26191.1 amidohydrolase [Williamsia sp. 1138]
MLIIGAKAITGETVSVRTERDAIRDVGAYLEARSGEDVVDLAGGTVIPGLHDHHVHLRAAAAAAASVSVGPPAVADADALRRVLRAAEPRPDGWIRAVGYHDSVAGDLDRQYLDDVISTVPLRVQHRSGAMWIVNSAGLVALGRPDHPTGRLYREDAEIAASTVSEPIDFASVSARLTAYGVAGVTEATPDLTATELDSFDVAVRSGRLRQRVLVLSQDAGHGSLDFGPIKRILDDDTLDLDALTAWIAHCHGDGVAVAMHCVTVVQLVVAVAALRTAGSVVGDRVEHAAMVPEEMIDDLVDLGVTVVTQPNFVAERGEQYLQDIPATDLPQLWRLASLQRAGVAVAGGTDAPFGGLDPWACMRAARDRLCASGAELSSSERVSAQAALGLFLGEPLAPARPRVLAPGARADLTLLSEPPAVVLGELTAEAVAGTVIGGVLYPND